MTSPAAQAMLTSTLLAILAIASFLAYAIWRYAPIIERIFEGKMMFLPLRVGAGRGGRGRPSSGPGDGFELGGHLLQDEEVPGDSGWSCSAMSTSATRWSAIPYAGSLCSSEGFDLFGFDCRNHGESQVDPSKYSPLQWVTDRELTDLSAALDLPPQLAPMPIRPGWASSG